MCESDPDLEEPLCVQWCVEEALIYEEREEEVEEETKKEDLEKGLKTLMEKFGLDKIMDTIARMSQNAWKQAQKNIEYTGQFPIGDFM